MADLKPEMKGAIAAFGMLAFYFTVLTLANSFEHAVSQFFAKWGWILLLSGGFGIQIYLYSHARSVSPAVCGGLSGGSMVACCLHHLTDVLPFAAAAFAAVVQYQDALLFTGVVSNAVGIAVILSSMGKIPVVVRNTVASVGAASVVIAFLSVPVFSAGASAPQTQYPERFDSGGGLEIAARPELRENLEITLKLNTHRGSLDVNFSEISYLVDGNGKIYRPIDFRATGSSHHKTVKLVFPRPETGSFSLVIENLYGVPKRTLRW